MKAPRCEKHGIKKVLKEQESGDKWRCPSCRAEQARDRHLKTTFGITQDDYLAMLAEQKGRCYLCRSKSPGRKATDHFMIDHDHETQRIRGLICHPCNQVLGYAKDNPKVLRRAAAYLDASELSSCSITPEAEKIIKRWALAQCYLYIRPITSMFLDPKKKPKLYWNVTVEHRGMDWNKWGNEGYDLSKVIVQLDGIVPRFSTKNLAYHPKDFFAGNMPVMKMEGTTKKDKKKRDVIGGYTPKPSKSSKGKAPKASSGRIRKKS